MIIKIILISGLLGFYGISTSVGYLVSNPFLYKQSVLIQSIQFNISIDIVYTQLNDKTVLFLKNSVNVITVSMSKTVPFKKIQFSISTQFKCKYTF